jgi:hypothetical protein
MKLFYLLLLLLCMVSSAKALTNTPELRCVSVETNGNIRLTWKPVTQTLGFSYYQVVESLGNIVGTLPNISDSTFLDTQSNGNASSHVYQIAAVYNLLTWNYSNQMFSIYLTTSNSSPSTNPGLATLNWNNSQSSWGNYEVYSNYNASGTLAPLHPGTFYVSLTDTQRIYDCNIVLQHQISVPDPVGCVSYSNIAYNTFSKYGNVVSNPDFRCISVLPSGNIQLTWQAPIGSGTDFNAYGIWRDGVLVDSVSNFTSNTYIDMQVNGNLQAHSYFIRSESGCSGHEHTTTGMNTLSSIFLLNSSPSSSSCQANWTAMPLLSSAPFYHVNRTISGNTLNITNTTGLQYVDVNPPSPSSPEYQISVPDNSGCISYSNISNGCTITGVNDFIDEGCSLKYSFNLLTNSFDLELPCANDSQLTIGIYNAIGQQVKIVVLNKSDKGHYKLERSNLCEGLNLFVIRTEKHSYFVKMMAL